MKFLHGRLSLFLTITALLVVGLVSVVVARKTTKSDSITLRSKNTASLTSSVDQPRQRGPQAELLLVTPSGFETAEITRPRGPFVLVIDDRSGLENMSLRLDHVAGANVRNLKTDRKKTELYDVLDLPPGDYVIREASTPLAAAYL